MFFIPLPEYVYLWNRRQILLLMLRESGLTSICRKIIRKSYVFWLRFLIISGGVVWGWLRTIICASVEFCQVKGQAGAPPWLAPRGKVFKIWTCRSSKNALVESLAFLTALNQLRNCVVFVTLHSSSPRIINPFPNNVPLLYPLKTVRFLMCSGGIEVEHWLKLVNNVYKITLLQSKYWR